MANARIGKPRIFTDWINPLIHQNYIDIANNDISFNASTSTCANPEIFKAFDLKPTNLATISCDGNSDDLEIIIDTNLNNNTDFGYMDYIAILNHNLKEAGAKVTLQSGEVSNYADVNSLTELSNVDSISGAEFTPDYNGYSLASFSPDTSAGNDYFKITISTDSTYSSDIKIGAIMIGKMYDFPHAPDV